MSISLRRRKFEKCDRTCLNGRVGLNSPVQGERFSQNASLSLSFFLSLSLSLSFFSLTARVAASAD